MVENSMLQRAVEDRRKAINRAEAAEAELARLRAAPVGRRIADLEAQNAHLRGLLERAERPCPVCGAPGRGADAPTGKP